jgi:hypothetical protein
MCVGHHRRNPPSPIYVIPARRVGAPAVFEGMTMLRGIIGLVITVVVIVLVLRFMGVM